MSFARRITCLIVGMSMFLCCSNAFSQSYAQTFQLTDSVANAFSLDRIGRQLYFSYYGAMVYRLDLNSGAVTSTGLVHSPPAFGNKRHILLFGDTLYDIDKGSSYGITPHDSGGTFGWSFVPSFSPNDSSLLFSGPGISEYCTSNYIFSLKDSSLTPIDTSVQAYLNCGDRTSPQWNSDTSFVYDVNCHAIAEYFIGSREIDTVVSSTTAPITGFACNACSNVIAYAVGSGAQQPQIYLHYLSTPKDSLIFPSASDDPSSFCLIGFNVFRDLCWSPDGNRLGFILDNLTNPVAGIFFYSLDSNRTYKTASCPEMADYKESLQWLNDDTLCYIDHTQATLYGMNILPVINAVSENQEGQIPESFGVSAYPNPFNPSTRIVVTLPSNINGVLSIYDVQGKLVREYLLKNDGRPTYCINWDGTNRNGDRIASGVYLVVLRSNIVNIEYRKAMKLMYLK